MLIGLVIIGALVTLFVNTSGNNRELARANSMIESGRFAIKVLEDDLVHAGYWSGFVPMFDDQTSKRRSHRCPDGGSRPLPRLRPRGLGRRLQDEPDRHPGAGLRRP